MSTFGDFVPNIISFVLHQLIFIRLSQDQLSVSRINECMLLEGPFGMIFLPMPSNIFFSSCFSDICTVVVSVALFVLYHILADGYLERANCMSPGTAPPL